MYMHLCIWSISRVYSNPYPYALRFQGGMVIGVGMYILDYLNPPVELNQPIDAPPPLKFALQRRSANRLPLWERRQR